MIFAQNYTLFKNKKYYYISYDQIIYITNIIIFLNGNKQDFDLENLACVSRSTLCTLNKLGWSNKEQITKTGIKWCEHLQAIKNSQKIHTL